jgi:NAD(P)H-dependent flavin oxidoreductase YrpB (nitropropane dioxygenase family)
VGSVDAAKEAVDSGIDLIIAQGSEAGGHNYGSLPTFVLVPSIREAVAPISVLAAGGVATGRQLAAALVLGADGVSIGTRFVASEEAFAHAEYKRRIVEATVRKPVFQPSMAPTCRTSILCERWTSDSLTSSLVVRTARPKTSTHNRSSLR